MTDSGVDRVPVAFARVLRSAGLDVPVGATITFAEGLATVGLERPDLVYWAGRGRACSDAGGASGGERRRA